MVDLRKRFGRLVAAHRKRRGLTQEDLASTADISVNMVTKIETGASGARFPVIERLAAALEVDPAELFTTELPAGALRRTGFVDFTSRLATLSDAELHWAANLLDAALKPKTPPPEPDEGRRPQQSGA